MVNLGFAPEPWLRWTIQRLGTAIPKTLPESLWLYRERLHPTGTAEGTDGWWGVTDEASASAAVEDMIVKLERGG